MVSTILSCLFGGMLFVPFWFSPPAPGPKDPGLEPSDRDKQVMCAVAEEMEPTTPSAGWLPRNAAKKVVVLSVASFCPLCGQEDTMTSALERSLWVRGTRSVRLEEPCRFGRIEITKYDLLKRDGATTESRDTAFVMMWLPGYSPDGREAMVYAWVTYGGDYAYEGAGSHYYLRQERGRWRIIGETEVWIT